MNRPRALHVSIPEWRNSDFSAFSESTVRLSALADSAGQTSDRFAVLCDKILRRVRFGGTARIAEEIQTNMDVRAVTFLLSTSEDFVKTGVLSHALLTALLRPRARLSRLSLLQLVRAFLVFFDRLGDQKVILTLANFIMEQLAFHTSGDHRQALVLNAVNKHLIFAPDGPVNVVNDALLRRHSLEDQFDLLSLSGYGNGRFQEICRYRFYIQTLEEIPVGDDHEVLRHLVQPDVYKAPGSDGGTLGHEVLKILIDRSPSQGASEAWRGVILTIAGDPRVAMNHERYSQWWALLGEGRSQKVRGWLSSFDLSLFLGALADYGATSGDKDLQRMFPARKRFLEGLIEQGLVVVTRLFVGSKAREYLKRNYKPTELPDHAAVGDSNRSMIYLQVGHCHMIEGSHNCTLWIFPTLPADSGIVDYGIRRFTPYDLGGRVKRKYDEEFGIGATKPAAIVHSPREFRWQHDAINYFEQQGLRLDTQLLFSGSDYRLYRRIHGVTI